jgi:hypothetical protein
MKRETGIRENILKSQKLNFGLIVIAASLLVLLGIGSYLYLNNCETEQNSNLGTFDDPEVAFRETQKVLFILSFHLKTGIESVQYIQEYDKSKNLIFKE